MNEKDIFIEGVINELKSRNIELSDRLVNAAGEVAVYLAKIKMLEKDLNELQKVENNKGDTN